LLTDGVGVEAAHALELGGVRPHLSQQGVVRVATTHARDEAAWYE